MSTHPFLGTEAVAAGRFTRRTLATRNVMLHKNVYLPKNVELTAETRAMAAWLWSGRRATVAGLSAAALHGSKWIDAELPAELIRPVACEVKGIVIRRDCLDETETCVVRGLAATTPARTAYDLGRRGTPTQAVVRLDALANATDLKPEDVAALLPLHRGARGLPQLRDAIALMDGGAESPQETRTRLLLIAAGFPRPETQIVVCDKFGEFVGRVDMGYRTWKVAIEYDGPQHWDGPEAHARDIERIADLEAQGWIVIRLSRDILRYRRSIFLARVRDAMRDRGWPDHATVRLDASLPR
ncbi:MAG: endonuclease domain-containing protein [Mycobacterium sp.]